MLSNAIESAQKRVEGKNFEIRKHVLQFDDVMNKQREVIYGQRKKVLNGENLKDFVQKMMDSIAESIVAAYCNESPLPDLWDWDGLTTYAENVFIPKGSMKFNKNDLEKITKEDLKEKMTAIAYERYEAKETELGSELMRELERVVLLRVVDEKWMDQLDAMDQLRHGINLRAYAQRDPFVEYRLEGFDMFEEMIKNMKEDTIRVILNTHLNKENAPQREKVAEPINATHGDEPKKPVQRGAKVGRNDQCPCGSGKKYKKCCGAN
jgi:preprotein translocase subunit SecA